jgi:hypothetical protein
VKPPVEVLPTGLPDARDLHHDRAGAARLGGAARGTGVVAPACLKAWGVADCRDARGRVYRMKR